MLVCRILDSSNASITVTNLVGAGDTSCPPWIPLGTTDGTATGEIGAKVIVVGGSFSATVTFPADNSAFTAGTTTFQPGGGFYHSTRDSLTDGRAGAVALTVKRSQYVTIDTPNGDSAMDDTNDCVKTSVLIQRGAANLATSQATSTGTAATLVAARATRRSVLFRNVETAGSGKDVYIGPATVTSGNGFLLKAGESIPFTWVGLIQVIDNGSDHAVIHIADEYD